MIKKLIKDRYFWIGFLVSSSVVAFIFASYLLIKVIFQIGL